MITSYGINLRMIRLVRNESITDMAKKVGFSISYLSMIENGHRKIPKNLTKKVIMIYDLSKKEKDDLINSENELDQKRRKENEKE